MAARLRAPGFYRAGLLMIAAVALAAGLTWVVRMSTGHVTYPHYLSGEAILTVSLLAVPLAFLVGIGGFDYWFYWATGRPTRPEDHSGHGAYSWRDYFRINTDHKVIGIQYLVNSFFFLLVGGLLAMLMRAQLAQPGSQFVSANTYNGLFSVHATLLIFLFMVPVFAGFGNFVIPLMIGAPDMAFPRLNALSFWLLPLAGTMMLLSFLAPGGAFADGWTAYTPLSIDAPVGQTFFSIGVQFAGASSIMTALNFLVTIITMRAPGMSFFRLPLLVWANFATSLLVVIATPFVAASQFFILLDRALGFNFFNAAKGGDVLDVPARLLVLLPPRGLHHDPARLRDHQRGHRGEGAQADLRLPHDGLLAAGDRGPRLHGLGAPHVHLRHGRLDPHPDGDHHGHHRRAHRREGLLLAGHAVARGAAPRHADAVRAGLHHHVHARAASAGSCSRWCRSTSTSAPRYFVVAHIHYVLFGGSLMTIFAGVYYWFPKMTGRMYDERLGKWHFWTTFVFMNLTFGPMHVLGLQGMPRRVATYAAQFADLNLLISIASFALGAATLLFVYNMITSWRGGPRAVATRGAR